jgi:hypothetical protein
MIAAVDPTWNGCNGAYLYEYFASASCVGQGTERTFPYDFADSAVCDTTTTAKVIERADMKLALSLNWACVTPINNNELMRAV